jgi:hypothetical protein
VVYTFAVLGAGATRNPTLFLQGIVAAPEETTSLEGHL